MEREKKTGSKGGRGRFNCQGGTGDGKGYKINSEWVEYCEGIK